MLPSGDEPAYRRRVRIGRLALGAAVCAALFGSAAADRFVKGPYLQNAQPRAVTVMWEGQAAPATVIVHGGKAGKGERRIEVPASARQEIVIDGLEPATRYRYQVVLGDETVAGELVTAPEPGTATPLTFVVYGDNRAGTEVHRQIVERVRAEVPDFILGTGDLVDEGGNLRQWQSFFDVEGPLLRDNVMFPALGNHDRQGPRRTADNYRQFFSVPDNGSDPERVYAFTWGPAHFLILDSNSYSFALTDQTAWLERELAAARQDPRIRQIFVVMHHPPYSISLHGGQRDLRERWTPLFERYGVTAVFSGHDHCYERAQAGGVRYFVSGGAGAALYPRGRRPSKIDLEAVERFERVAHFLRIHVIGDLVEVTAIRADGTPIETTTWGERARPVAPAVATTSGADAVVAKAGAAAPAATRPAEREGLLPIVVVAGLIVLAAGAALWWLSRARAR
jgi:hypothetical protein